MQLHNLRLGFATNSSSSHSIIIYSGAKDSDLDRGHFGWQLFTAASVKARKLYIATTLKHTLSRFLNTEMIVPLVKGLTGVKLTLGSTLMGKCIEQYIDHQSLFLLPLSRDLKGVNLEFFKDFTDFILQDNLVILGGNDNYEEGDEGHPLLGAGPFIRLPIPVDVRGPFIARKDEDYWTMFSLHSGDKVRFSFKDLEHKVKKSTFPELVDLKITDCCTAGCNYCYQGSSPGGKHASHDDIIYILRSLEDMEVFEVAIGGGEPLLHPDFMKILEECKYRHIVPSFTTHRTTWLLGKDAATILDQIGACGISVVTADQVDVLHEVLVQTGISKEKVTVQCVIGCVDELELKKILEATYECKLKVLLLGYKPLGRGVNFEPKKCDWIKVVISLDKCPTLSIDTLLAQKHQEQLEELEVSPFLYETEEGKFSMYIDAVEMTCGPSSYTGEPIPLDRKDLFTSILRAYQAF